MNDSFKIAGVLQLLYPNALGCDYVNNFMQCHQDPAEVDYQDYIVQDGVRRAIHVGDQEFSHKYVQSKNIKLLLF